MALRAFSQRPSTGQASNEYSLFPLPPPLNSLLRLISLSMQPQCPSPPPPRWISLCFLCSSVRFPSSSSAFSRTTSLMSCWAVATAVATRMSSAAVGAHQVTLSLWLLFALVAEAPSIAAQVLGARYEKKTVWADRFFFAMVASDTARGRGGVFCVRRGHTRTRQSYSKRDSSVFPVTREE